MELPKPPTFIAPKPSPNVPKHYGKKSVSQSQSFSSSVGGRPSVEKRKPATINTSKVVMYSLTETS